MTMQVILHLLLYLYLDFIYTAAMFHNTLDDLDAPAHNCTKGKINTKYCWNDALRMTDEQRLFCFILMGYDKNTRPVFNASNSVKVNIGITLTQIFDLDEKNQALTTNVWLDQQWMDEKLTWDPHEFNGIYKLRIPCRHIWKPDIVLYNSVEDYTDGYMQSLAMISHTGQVFWPPIVKFHSTCQIDITYFPFDDQICLMKLGSWAYDGFQVDVDNRSQPVDLSNYISNGEWRLIAVVAQRNVVYYPCCPEPFPDVTFTLHLRRRTLYYTHNVIIPCVMLSCLTLLVFWMSPDSGEKITLGLTVLLAFSVFMLLVAENMPATSNFVPLIGVYLTMVMGITSVSVVLAVLVSNINLGGRFNTPLPILIHRSTIVLSSIIRYRLQYFTPRQKDKRPRSDRPLSRKQPYNARNRPHVYSDSGYGLLDYELTENFSRSPEDSCYQLTFSPDSRQSKDDDVVIILKLLKQALLKENEREESEDVRKQWEEAACVLDRFLFYIFFLLTVVTSTVTLVIIPLTKPELPPLENET